jgi:OFA family oxalate/formate antiporter-like MFS transporter
MQNFKRWVYLFTGTLMLLFHGVIYAWSIFRQPFNEIYPSWSLSQISFAFTLSIIFFWVGGFIAGNLSRKVSINFILRIVALLLFVGFIGTSEIGKACSESALKFLYLFYGILCGIGIGMGFNGIISSVNKWFPDRTGLASGIMMMGFGFGGIVLGGGINSLVLKIGLFGTFKCIAVIIASIVLIGSIVLKAPETNATADGNSLPAEGYSTKQMLSTKRFWIFSFWTMMINSAGLLVINNAASISLAFGAPAVLGLIISICNGIGRAMLGFFFDKFRGKITILIDVLLIILAGIVLLLGSIYSSLALIFAGIIFVGLGYGGSPPITSTYVNTEFGSKNFAVNFSLASFSLVPASLIGPMISSKLIEGSGGSYSASFLMIAVMGIIAFILWLFLYNISSNSRLKSQ